MLYAKFKEFSSVEEAIEFGTKYFYDWLKEFQVKGEFRHLYELNDTDNMYLMIKMKYGQEYADKIKDKCLIYRDFSYYCGGTYGLAINELCRYGYTNYTYNVDTLRSMIERMDSEINKHEIKENIVVYRTFSYTHLLEAQERKKIIKGDIIIDQGFMGCGLVKETLLKEHEYDTVMKIFIPAGYHALYLDFISSRRNEQEVLFKRGARLKVLFNKKSFFSNKRNIICVAI